MPTVKIFWTLKASELLKIEPTLWALLMLSSTIIMLLFFKDLNSLRFGLFNSIFVNFLNLNLWKAKLKKLR